MPAGAPNWPGLLRRLAEELEPDVRRLAEERIEARRFLEAGTLVKAEFGERLYELLDRIFDLDVKAPGLIHPLLALIPFRVRLTTNYDQLIFIHDAPVHPTNP